MAASHIKGVTRKGRTKILGLMPRASTTPPADTAPASLPLQEPETPLPATREPTVLTRRYPDDSKVRQAVMHIIAMRIAGIEEEEIATSMHLTRGTIRTYMYIAGQNGWLQPQDIPDPKDRIEYTLGHKVLANLEEALDDPTRNENTGMPVKTAVALKVAEGTLFKKFGEMQVAPSQVVVALKIEMPPGEAQPIREGTIGGKSSYVDGETS